MFVGASTHPCIVVRPEAAMSASAPNEQQVFQSIKRACYAGLDSGTLRAEVSRRVQRMVPTDQDHFWAVDPETGLISDGVARNPSPGLIEEFVGHHYPDDDATSLIDQARARVVLRSGGLSPALRDMAERWGVRQAVRALFFTPEACWGSWCLLRGQEPRFTDRELRFLERIAPHVAEGLKSAALMELASREPEDDGEQIAVDPVPNAAAAAPTAPGFLVLGPDGEVALRTATVGAYLADLSADDDAPDGALPPALLSVRGRLFRRQAAPEDAPEAARVRARGRSGRWYTLQATLSEPDANGRASTVVTIEPLARREVAPLLFRLYGLSPREREVLVWVVRGEPTKRIAHHLGLSAHTVQDYLDKACDKVGVRGRKALVSKLFRDGFAPGVYA
jgi:DNA-binding CsgD family transcriptional regulator